MIFEIIYMAVLFFSTFFIVLHIHLWLEHKDKIFLKGTSKILPTISLIVPAYNEEDIIEKTLEKLKHLDYPKNKLEIIVVDDGSTDSTFEIAKRKAKEFGRRMKVFTKRNLGKASALNFGVKKARNDYVAVVDADSFLDRGTLKKAVTYFDDDKVAAVTSHVLCSKKDSFWERMQNMELMVIAVTRKLEEYINIIWVTPGPLSIYRKDILKKIGGFDEKVLVEDVEIAWRIHKNGYNIKMAFNAFAYSLYPNSFSRWWKQRLRWAVGGIQTLLKYKSSITDRTTSVGSFFVPTAFIGYSSTVIAIGIFLYLVSINAFDFLLFASRAYSIGLDPLSRIEFSYYVDYKIILGFIAFFVTLPLIKISLGLHKKMVRWYDIPIFLFIYPILYSFVNLHAVYKYVKGETGWLTK